MTIIHKIKYVIQHIQFLLAQRKEYMLIIKENINHVKYIDQL